MAICSEKEKFHLMPFDFWFCNFKILQLFLANNLWTESKNIIGNYRNKDIIFCNSAKACFSFISFAIQLKSFMHYEQSRRRRERKVCASFFLFIECFSQKLNLIRNFFLRCCFGKMRWETEIGVWLGGYWDVWHLVENFENKDGFEYLAGCSWSSFYFNN